MKCYYLKLLEIDPLSYGPINNRNKRGCNNTGHALNTVSQRFPQFVICKTHIILPVAA